MTTYETISYELAIIIQLFNKQIELAVLSSEIHWERGIETFSSTGGVGLVTKCGQDWWTFDTMSISPGEEVVMISSKVKALSVVY